MSPYTTVGDLIKALATVDPTLIVIQSRDPEGNGYGLFDQASVGAYLPEGGEYWESEDEWEEEKAPEGSIPCLCFWPLPE